MFSSIYWGFAEYTSCSCSSVASVLGFFLNVLYLIANVLVCLDIVLFCSKEKTLKQRFALPFIGLYESSVPLKNDPNTSDEIMCRLKIA